MSFEALLCLFEKKSDTEQYWILIFYVHVEPQT